MTTNICSVVFIKQIAHNSKLSISVNLKIPGFLRIARVVYFSVPTNAVIVAAICWRRFL